ncbi:hypothetical protein BUALT_Bualt03G0231300 [Buddleja alternifolia]|uniref:Endonuclease/exonuclease/phosphatase domain-containing protein n=1 Tax=Buddleja alternifolia TaxID=168488 RepID=A0AAV6Y4N1_9LAMI|nr:hypothetical protein BUALT_Bualt03G0231300 [Buddleja alternifolia]
MEDFGNMLADSRLLDAGFEGEPLTWTNRRLWQRLDRALISINWAEIFGSTRVIHHPRGISDHSPLEIIAESSSRRTPASFRFQNMWLKHHDFFQSSKDNWSQPIEAYEKEVVEAEANFDQCPIEGNLIEMNRKNVSLKLALAKESCYWKQKSSCKWLEEGERNTKYFHALVKKKRLRSVIQKIQEENREITNPLENKQSRIDFFECLLSSPINQVDLNLSDPIFANLPTIQEAETEAEDGWLVVEGCARWLLAFTGWKLAGSCGSDLK